MKNNIAQSAVVGPSSTICASTFDCIRAEQARVRAALDSGAITTARDALEVAGEHVDSAAERLLFIDEEHFGPVRAAAAEMLRVARRLEAMAHLDHRSEAAAMVTKARDAYVEIIELFQDIEETVSEVVAERMPPTDDALESTTSDAAAEE